MKIQRPKPQILRALVSCLLLAVGFLQGCASYRSTEGPMNLVEDNLQCRLRPETLIVFLPGAYDTPRDLIEQGFISAVRERKIYADIQLVDAHTGYYTSQQILPRLEAEVIEPARAKGYRQIWFAGISLGGYGTLLYSKKHPAALEGFFIMAPYMGARDIPLHIQRQGGLKNWSSAVQGNMDIDLWRWLQAYGRGQQPTHPQAWLGYGASDRFASANRLLADVLPAGRAFVVPGGHDWPAWRQLWTKFLDAAPLQRISAETSGCSGA